VFENTYDKKFQSDLDRYKRKQEARTGMMQTIGSGIGAAIGGIYGGPAGASVGAQAGGTIGKAGGQASSGF
jgi:hypothetical protein